MAIVEVLFIKRDLSSQVAVEQKLLDRKVVGIKVVVFALSWTIKKQITIVEN